MTAKAYEDFCKVVDPTNWITCDMSKVTTDFGELLNCTGALAMNCGLEIVSEWYPPLDALQSVMEFSCDIIPHVFNAVDAHQQGKTDIVEYECRPSAKMGHMKGH